MCIRDRNIGFVDLYDPEYVAVLSGDHIYKMDYAVMLRRHKETEAACTIACLLYTSTLGHAVDSSAAVRAGGSMAAAIRFRSCKKEMASRFSWPP